MLEINLKNGIKVTVREANSNDAQMIIDFYNIVGGETDFLSFGGNEFRRDLQEYKNYLDATVNEQNSIILLAFLNNQIISIASINSTQKKRNMHVGTLGIVVKKEYWGISLGRYLMEYLIEWAKQNGITKKIQLVSNEDNEKAINLYKNLGFEIEGIMNKDTYINGKFYNTVAMGLFL